MSVQSKKSIRHDTPARIQRSVSLHSERVDRKELPFVLSVDFPSCQSAGPDSTSQICSTAQHLSQCGPYVSPQESSYGGFPDLSSLCSNNSLATIPHHDRQLIPTFPVLPHIRSSLGQPSTTASSLVLQMEHERERGNLSRCLKLAQEREELERELLKYTLEKGSLREFEKEQPDMEMSESIGKDFVWQYKSNTLPHRYPPSSEKCSSLSQNHFSSSSVNWEAHPIISPPSLIPARTPLSPSSFNLFQSITKQTPFRSEEVGSFSKDRSTHLPLIQQRHERVEAAPEGYDNSPQSAVLEMQKNDSLSEAWRQNNLSHGSLSTLSFHSNKYTERSNLTLDAVPDSLKAEVVFSGPTDEDVCVEMSVDEPELEVCVIHPTKPMLHHRIASHLQQGHLLTGRGQSEDMRRSTSYICRSPTSVDEIIRVPASQQPAELERWRAVTKGSKVWDSKQRSQSLDLRRRKESHFLTPDAWIDSLSQENCSVASSFHIDTLFKEPQNSPSRKISKSPANSPSANQTGSHLPPTVNPLSSRSSSNRPIPNPDVPCHYEQRREASIFPNAAKWPVANQQDAIREGYLDVMKASWLSNDNNDHEGLEVEAGSYEGVPESGSSYSSYASSGRGSMEHANGRLSRCHLSPTLSSSPETVEESRGSEEDKHSHQMEPRQRY